MGVCYVKPEKLRHDGGDALDETINLEAASPQRFTPRVMITGGDQDFREVLRLDQMKIRLRANLERS